MSIWVTTDTIGVDDHGEHDRSVLAVTHSSRYPSAEDHHGIVDLAHIPPERVLDWEDIDDEIPGRVGPWLRLAVDDGQVCTEVALNRDAAAALRDALDAWVHLDHLHPKETP